MGANRESKVTVGKVFSTNTYGDLVIEEVYPRKAKVRFLDTGSARLVGKCDILAGKVKDLYKPIVHGFGFRGEGVPIKGNKVHYRQWYSMIERCYDPTNKAYKENYFRVSVCDDWRNFQNYLTWCKNQKGCGNDGWNLDKDILNKDSYIYSPETCCFVPKEINLAIVAQRVNGDFKYGIYYCGKINKFVPRTRQKDKEKNDRYIGVFDTESDAIEAYKFHKKEYIKFLADKFKDQIDGRVYEALCSWVV